MNPGNKNKQLKKKNDITNNKFLFYGGAHKKSKFQREADVSMSFVYNPKWQAVSRFQVAFSVKDKLVSDRGKGGWRIIGQEQL
jgi:hypothetical protein